MEVRKGEKRAVCPHYVRSMPVQCVLNVCSMCALFTLYAKSVGGVL